MDYSQEAYDSIMSLAQNPAEAYEYAYHYLAAVTSHDSDDVETMSTIKGLNKAIKEMKIRERQKHSSVRPPYIGHS